MKYVLYITFLALFLYGCKPELLVTSSITVYMESVTVPSNAKLYGLRFNSAEGENSGLHTELVFNSDFDMGDTVPGWRPLGTDVFIKRSDSRPMSYDNPNSLMISFGGGMGERNGGAAAKGLNGIPLRQGERYSLSVFMRAPTAVTPVPVEMALMDSSATKMLGSPFRITPSHEWTRYSHSFVANEDAEDALLTFTIDSVSYFFIDKVSLIPENTWKGHGFRSDVMALLDSLSPSFLIYKEKSRADLYRQMSEDLNAEFVSGVADLHLKEQSFYTGEKYLISGRYIPDTTLSAGRPGIFVSGLGVTDGEENRSTLRSTVAEAYFLIGAENNPKSFGRIAFSPVIWDYSVPGAYSPLIYTAGGEAIASTSYYLLKMFSQNRGDVLLKSEVNTYAKPQVETAAPLFESPDRSFEMDNINVSRSKHEDSLYIYEINASLRYLKKGNGQARMQITPSIFMTMGDRSAMYMQAGMIRDTLSSCPLNLHENTTYPIRICCRYDTMQCYLGDTLIHHAILPSLPSVSATASLDKTTRTIILKVVNGTAHHEKTDIRIIGANLQSGVSVIEIKGDPESDNDLEEPNRVVPEEKSFDIPFSRIVNYRLPPYSVSIIKFRISD